MIACVRAGEFAVLADPTRIEQVLVNVLTDAAKFTEESGSITLSARRGREVVVAVMDDGINMRS